jgi:MATE family multidrug resistance protein
VAALAGVFARYLLLNLPGVVLYDILRKALQARSVVLPMLVIAVGERRPARVGSAAGRLTRRAAVCDAIMVVTCYVLIVERGGGYLSVAVARTACYTAGLVLLLAYVALSGEGARFWGGWSRRGARRLGEYVRLGVPGMLQMCLEWWAFEAILVISGYMRDSHTAIGAMSVRRAAPRRASQRRAA